MELTVTETPNPSQHLTKYILRSLPSSLMVDVVQRKKRLLGHILRREELENLVLTGFDYSKRGRERHRETFLIYLGKITHALPLELLRLARIKDVCAKLCTLHSTSSDMIRNGWLIVCLS